MATRSSVPASGAGGTRGTKRRSVRACASPAGAAAREGKICVLGGGLLGASTAYWLCERGGPEVASRVVVVERDYADDATLAPPAASGKGGGFIARDWGGRGPTGELHRLGFDLHARLAEELGVASYRRIPTYSVTANQGRASGSPRLETGTPGWLDGGELREVRFMDDATAQTDPKELCSKLLLGARERGAAVVSGVAEGLEIDEGSGAVTSVTLEGGGGSVDGVAALVVAMGPWSVRAESWFEGLRVPLEGIKSTSLVFDGDERTAASPAALFCAEDVNGCHMEVYPRNNGQVYCCGLGGSDYVSAERLKPGGDCDSPAKISADPARVSAGTATLRGMAPGVAGEGPLHTQACMRPCAPDAMPIMGPVPGCPNAFLNCGHNCWGISWSPAAGLAMAELVLDGRSGSIDLKPFSPGRFQPRAQSRGRKFVDRAVGEQW